MAHTVACTGNRMREFRSGRGAPRLVDPRSSGRDALAAGLSRVWRKRTAISVALYPASLVYRGLMGIRGALYKNGILKRYRAPCPVIVVGNISVGGNGKTPFTIWLTQWLLGKDYRPGIVLRGYGGHSDHWPLPVTAETPARLAGDEAVLLAASTSVPVVAGPDRGEDCRMLVERFGCNVIVSDDGLQHLAMHRDYELVLHDSESGMGNGWCLPAGPMREPLERLRHVDQVVIYGDREHGIAASAGVATNLSDPRRCRPLSGFAGTRVLAITAIARPERFFDDLTRAGIQADQRAFPDHHEFQPGNLEADGYDTVLITGKDAVKLRGIHEPRIWVVALQLEVSKDVVQRLEHALLPLLQTT